MASVWCSDRREREKNIIILFFLPEGTEGDDNLLIHSKGLCQRWNFNLDLLSLLQCHFWCLRESSLEFLSHFWRQRVSHRLPSASIHDCNASDSYSEWQEALSFPAGKISVFIIFSTCILEGYLCRLRSSHVTTLLFQYSRVMVPAAEYLHCSFDPQLWREIYQRRGGTATAVFAISIYLCL